MQKFEEQPITDFTTQVFRAIEEFGEVTPNSTAEKDLVQAATQQALIQHPLCADQQLRVEKFLREGPGPGIVPSAAYTYWAIRVAAELARLRVSRGA